MIYLIGDFLSKLSQHIVINTVISVLTNEITVSACPASYLTKLIEPDVYLNAKHDPNVYKILSKNKPNVFRINLRLSFLSSKQSNIG